MADDDDHEYILDRWTDIETGEKSDRWGKKGREISGKAAERLTKEYGSDVLKIVGYRVGGSKGAAAGEYVGDEYDEELAEYMAERAKEGFGNWAYIAGVAAEKVEEYFHRDTE